MKHEDAPGLFEQPARPFRFDAEPVREGAGPGAIPSSRFTGESGGTDEPVNRSTMAARVARFFKERPNAWIDGRDLARVAGAYAWRTRVSDIRRPPFNMVIENRQRRVGGYVVSEYRLVESGVSS